MQLRRSILKRTNAFLILVYLLAIVSLQSNAYNLQTLITYPNITTNSTVFKPIFNGQDQILFYNGYKKYSENAEKVSGYYKFEPSLGWVHYSFNEIKNLYAITKGIGNTIAVLSFTHGIGPLVSVFDDYKICDTKHVGASDRYHFALNQSIFNGVQSLVTYSKFQDFPEQPNTIIYSSIDGTTWIENAIPGQWNYGLSWGISVKNIYIGAVFNKFIVLQTSYNSFITKLSISEDFTNWSKLTIPFSSYSVQKAFYDNNLFVVVVKNERDKQQKLWITQDLINWVDFHLPYNVTVNDLQQLTKNKILMLLNYENYYPDVEIYNAYETELILLDTDTDNLKVVQKFDGFATGLVYKDNQLYISGDFINPSDGARVALALLKE